MSHWLWFALGFLAGGLVLGTIGVLWVGGLFEDMFRGFG